MFCPVCGYENLAGSAFCEDCLTDLSHLYIPSPVAGLQALLLRDPIRKVAAAKPVLIGAESTVQDASEAMVKAGLNVVLVVQHNRVAGIFTARDLLYKIEPGSDLSAIPVCSIMTHDPVCLLGNDTVAVALNKMTVGGFYHIPIVRGGRPIGLVSGRDILHHLCERVQPRGRKGNKGA